MFLFYFFIYSRITLIRFTIKKICIVNYAINQLYNQFFIILVIYKYTFFFFIKKNKYHIILIIKVKK